MISYRIVRQEKDFCVVADKSEEHQCMSLTNGAEYLVKELHQRGLLNEGMRLGYYDTTGQLDEIIFDKSVWESNGSCKFKGGFNI
jgi:hypothetical protein